MMTAMLTVDNIAAGHAQYDIWCVNEDAEYHEAGNEGAQKAITEQGEKQSNSTITADQAAALNSLRDVPQKVKEHDDADNKDKKAA